MSGLRKSTQGLRELSISTALLSKFRTTRAALGSQFLMPTHQRHARNKPEALFLRDHG
jgi:hypothetical protein